MLGTNRTVIISSQTVQKNNMTSKPAPYKPFKVVYYDGAIAYGGSLEVLSTLFNSLDRSTVSPSLIACTPEMHLSPKFRREDIGCVLKPPLNYSDRERWLNRFDGQPQIVFKLAAYAFSLVALSLALPNQCRLFFHLYRTRPDLIHINNNYSPILAARLLGIPIIWHLHGVPARPSPWERFLLNAVNQFISISHYVAAQAEAVGFPTETMIVQHNSAPHIAPETNDIRSALLTEFGIPSNHKLIAHVGRLLPWKGQLQLLHAMAKVVQNHPNVTALIVGDDKESINSRYIDVLREFVTKSGLESNVRFTGHRADILNVMASVDAVVHTSIEPEPFGLVIVEAMSVGTPVVASDIGAPREIITNNETGIIAPPGDAAELARSIATILFDPSLNESIKTKCKELVRRHFSPDIFAGNIAALYQKLLGQAAPPPRRSPK